MNMKERKAVARRSGILPGCPDGGAGSGYGVGGILKTGAAFGRGYKRKTVLRQAPFGGAAEQNRSKHTKYGKHKQKWEKAAKPPVRPQCVRLYHFILPPVRLHEHY